MIAPRFAFAISRPVSLIALGFSLAFSAAGFAASPAARPGATPSSPNVIFIFADDLGYGDLGCYGANDIRTPHVDRLATEGTRFTSFYVAQAVCTASRAALMTGSYANRVSMSGALNHTSPTGLHPREKLLPQLFKERDYATAMFGKWHLGHHPPFLPTRRGFDEWLGIPYSNDNGPLHPVTRGIPSLPLYENETVVELDPDQAQFTRRLTERAVAFIEKNRARPFFLYVPHIMPHVPIFASQKFRGTSGRGLYGDVVQELDWSVGEIMATLRRLGLDERTLVVFSSDNGPFLSYGEHAGSARPLREGKLTTFEGGMRTPCLVRWPGRVPAGRVSDEPFSTMDFYVSFARLIGAALPDVRLDGIDVTPLLLGEPGAKGRAEYWYYAGEELHAVRQGDWKLHVPHEFLTVAAEPGRGGKPSNWANMKPLAIEVSGIRGIASRHGYRVEKTDLALFNLKDDPSEARNLAAAQPAIVARLQQVVRTARADLGDALTKTPATNARPAGDIRTALPLDQRPAKPDEWGYRPADGAAVPLNPPSFTWIVPDAAAATYTVQWARDRDFRAPTTATDIVWPTYTHHEAFASGTWYWRYRYANARGGVSEWSTARRVEVPAGAAVLPMPTLAQQKSRVPQAHPRLFLRPEDLPRLRALARGREAATFAALRQTADAFIAAGPTPEPAHRGSARDKENAELVKYWWPNREQTERACNEAETIAFVYLISGDKIYGEAARRWVLHLAAWDPKGNTNFTLNCEAGKPMLYRPARAYDWAWDMFTPAERAKIQIAMRARVLEAWNSGEIARGVGHLQRPYSSHGNRIWHKVAEAGIAFLDEIPEAPQWLDYAVNKFFACYPVWSDDDGGWHEGVSYWSGYQNKAVWWLQVAQSALGIDGLKKPFYAQVGDYPLYVAPPHSPNAGFGDLAARPINAPSFLEYHLRARAASGDGGNAGYWSWWAQQKEMRENGGVLGFLYRANLPPLPAPKPPTDLPPSKVFHGIGVASLHTTLLDSRDDVHFLFKASPFGSQSHGHNPQNSFQLNAYGEALLVACGYRDLHGSKFHYQWVHSTRAQNAVLVNGEGQIPHSVTSTGRIVREQFSPAYDYIAGDATVAYGGRLQKAWRHAVFVKGPQPFLVLYDELVAPQPARFQFMSHALSPFVVDAGSARLRVQQPKAGLEVAYLSPVPLTFVQTDGFKPAPSREFPNHWHVEAGTTEPRRELGMVTVLVPHRSGQAPVWESRRRDEANGPVAEVTVAGRRHLIRFPTPGGDQPVKVELPAALVFETATRSGR